MRLRDMALGTCLLGLALTLVPEPAQACSTSHPIIGLDLYDLWSEQEIVTLADGVIALGGTVYAAEPADAAEASMTLSRSGETIETTVELRTLHGEIRYGAPYWDVALVFRPVSPLTAGASYTATVTYAGEYGVGTFELPVRVEAGPLPAFSPPEVQVEPSSEVSNHREWVCCERGIDSCGGSSSCVPTVHDVQPALVVEPLVAAEPAVAGNSLVWAAAVLPDGALSERRFAQVGRYSPEWTVIFSEAQDEYCVVVGRTNLVNGTEVRSDPLCAPTVAPAEVHEEVPEDYFDELGCLSPPIHEDGTPFGEAPAPAEQGCRIGQVSGAGGLFALLLVSLARRRRRARSTRRVA